MVYEDDQDEYDDEGNVYSCSDADDGHCKHDDCDDDDDHAVAANIYSYLHDDTQPTLLSEGSIACSSHRHDNKSENQTTNLYTRHTSTSPPPATSSVLSRLSLKRNRKYVNPSAYGNTAVPRVRNDEP